MTSIALSMFAILALWFIAKALTTPPDSIRFEDTKGSIALDDNRRRMFIQHERHSAQWWEGL